MKIRLISAAITMACVTFGGSALACGTDAEFAPRPRPRPVQQVQQVSFQQEASTLFARATELDSAASTRERNASTFDNEADVLAARARSLRNQAQLVSFSTDRESILDIADDGTRSSSARRSIAPGPRPSAPAPRKCAPKRRRSGLAPPSSFASATAAAVAAGKATARGVRPQAARACRSDS